MYIGTLGQPILKNILDFREKCENCCVKIRCSAF